MKQMFLAAIALICSSQAFAVHAYYSMDCKSEQYQLRYKGNYPVGGDYGISLKGTDVEKVDALELLALPNWGKENPYGEEALKGADLVYLEKSETIGEVKKSSACEFDHEEWTSKRVIEVERVSDLAIQKLGLKKGQKIEMMCNESTDYPSDSEEAQHCP